MSTGNWALFIFLLVVAILLLMDQGTFLFHLEYWDLMNESEKQDLVPELWEGHNVADYIDPEIMKVSSNLAF